MLRLKRIIAGGPHQLEPGALEAGQLRPAKPDDQQASRGVAQMSPSCLLLQFLLQLFEQIQRLQRRQRIHVRASMRSTMRCESGVKIVSCIGSAVSTCTLWRSCFSCCRSTCLARSMTAAGRPASCATSIP